MTNVKEIYKKHYDEDCSHFNHSRSNKCLCLERKEKNPFNMEDLDSDAT